MTHTPHPRLGPTEAALRQLVRRILREAPGHAAVGDEPLPPPDAPGQPADQGLGQWAMPALRSDPAYQRAAIAEPDTDLERRLARALRSHYDDNEDAPLGRIWDQLVALRDGGLYPGLLETPGGHAYRFMMLTPERAALFLGVPQEELEGAALGRAHRAPSPPPFRPRGLIASWTLDPTGLIRRGEASLFVWREPGMVAVLLRARTPQPAFLLNPERLGRDWSLAPHLAFETEVLSGGPVELDGAAWVWFPGDRARGSRGFEAMRDEQRVLGRALLAALG